MSEVFREVRESLTMEQVAAHFGYEPNRTGFIHSPFNQEKTPSCRLYTNSFYDFSSNTGGDLIAFSAAILGVNNWKAAQYLIQAFSLPISLSGSADYREEVEQRHREQQRQQERQREFRAALLAKVGELKMWEQAYQRVIDLEVYPPLSEMQRYVISELQKVTCKLDILCGSNMAVYRRMKPDVKNGISSDRPQWLLDVLAVLEEDEAFHATQSELEEIKVQRDFELLERRPGKDRVCNIEWIKKVLRNKYEGEQPKERREPKRKQEIMEDLHQKSDRELLSLLQTLN